MYYSAIESHCLTAALAYCMYPFIFCSVQITAFIASLRRVVRIIWSQQLALAEGDAALLAGSGSDDSVPPKKKKLKQTQKRNLEEDRKDAVMAVFVTLLGHMLSSPYTKGQAFPALAEKQLVEELCQEHPWMQKSYQHFLKLVSEIDLIYEEDSGGGGSGAEATLSPGPGVPQSLPHTDDTADRQRLASSNEGQQRLIDIHEAHQQNMRNVLASASRLQLKNRQLQLKNRQQEEKNRQLGQRSPQLEQRNRQLGKEGRKLETKIRQLKLRQAGPYREEALGLVQYKEILLELREQALALLQQKADLQLPGSFL